MDALSAILACSLYLDDAIVRAVIESNSQSNPLFVLDASSDVSQVEGTTPKSVNEAVARVEDIASNGGFPLLGLMQIPMVWIADYGRSVGDAFDPCTNIAIGTAMLSQFAYECHSRRPRACVAKKYADAIGMPDFAQVLALQLAHQRPSVPPSSAPIFSDGAHPWGSDAILFSSGGAR